MQWRAVERARQDGAGGAVESESGDIPRAAAGASQRLGDGVARRLPPLRRILFGPGRTRMMGVERGRGVAPAGAGGVIEGGADALGADVEAEEERRFKRHGAAWHTEGFNNETGVDPR